MQEIWLLMSEMSCVTIAPPSNFVLGVLIDFHVNGFHPFADVCCVSFISDDEYDAPGTLMELMTKSKTLK